MIQQIHPIDVAEKLAAGEPIYFLDVRQQWEHDYCAISESTLIPLNELPQRIDEIKAPDNSLVVVYCHHGIRSLSGAAILQSSGFVKVASMSGGIDAWSVLVDPKVPKY